MTEANPVVLVVDDEVQIHRFLRAGLELDGRQIETKIAEWTSEGFKLRTGRNVPHG